VTRRAPYRPYRLDVQLLDTGSKSRHQRIGIDSLDRNGVDAPHLVVYGEQQDVRLWRRRHRPKKWGKAVPRAAMDDEQAAAAAHLRVSGADERRGDRHEALLAGYPRQLAYDCRPPRSRGSGQDSHVRPIATRRPKHLCESGNDRTRDDANATGVQGHCLATAIDRRSVSGSRIG
jgi:hypothetical protein